MEQANFFHILDKFFQNLYNHYKINNGVDIKNIKLIIKAIAVVLAALFVLQGCNENSKDKNKPVEPIEPEETVELEGKLLILQAYG